MCTPPTPKHWSSISAGASRSVVACYGEVAETARMHTLLSSDNRRPTRFKFWCCFEFVAVCLVMVLPVWRDQVAVYHTLYINHGCPAGLHLHCAVGHYQKPLSNRSCACCVLHSCSQGRPAMHVEEAGLHVQCVSRCGQIIKCIPQ